MKHALILGLSGIVGFNLAKHLLINQEWKVTGVLRKPRPYLETLVQQTEGLLDCITVDLRDAAQVRYKLAPLVPTITHVFYVTWLPGETEEEQCEVNAKMLENILRLFEPPLGKAEDGSPATHPLQHSLEHFYLQTGTKYYYMPKPNVNLAPFKEDADRQPGLNFYYPQEDLLAKFAEKSTKRALMLGTGRTWTYSIGRPGAITGFTQGTKMNFGVSLGVYASVMKELGKPLVWPYGLAAYNTLHEFSDANIISRFILWQNKNRDHVDGQAFNIANGDLFRFSQLWPLIAEYFDLDVEIADQPFSLEKFMGSNEVQKAWENLTEKYSLKCGSLKELCTFDFVDFWANRTWDDFSSLEKLRRFGFFDMENTESAVYGLFDSLQLTKIIPTLKRALPCSI